MIIKKDNLCETNKKNIKVLIYKIIVCVMYIHLYVFLT